MSKLVPKYTIWEAINAAVSVSTRALEEIRALSRIPGPRGPDGLGFDDLKILHDGERGFTFRMERGDQVKEFSFKIPTVLDRGVYKETRETPYEKGDGVTFGGSFWIAQKDAPEGRPQDGNPSWKLAVKRGRDGKDGKAPPGQIGPVSVPGAKSDK
jgi:hypothetical protein